MSLGTRILLLALLATLVPALTFAAYQFRNRNHEIERAKLDLAALARYAGENLDDKIKGTVQLLHGMSRAPAIDTADKEACSRFLAGVLGRYPQYTGLLTITPAGDLHCDSLRSGRKLNVGSREYFRQASATLEPAFEVVFGGLTGIAVVQVAYPAVDERGSLKYILLASVNLSRYVLDLAAASYDPTLRVLVWDRQGTLMVRKPDTGGESITSGQYPASALFRFASTGGAGSAAELPGMDGAPMVWALGVAPAGARIMLGVERERLLAGAQRDWHQSLAVLVGASLLALLGAWYMAETGIRRHVRRIAAIAERVGAGELDARIGAPYPPGELGQLMAVVDRTATAVQAQQQEIESRRRDLQRANRTLRVLSGINTLIVRARSHDELFRESCRIAVEEGQFTLAWIGRVDRSTMKLVPMAKAGAAAGLLDALGERLTSLDVPASRQGPVAVAVRERRAVVVNDVVADPGIHFKDAHLTQGIRSFVVLPVLVEGEAVALLGLHSAETGYFDEPEVNLLRELAGDIAFAMDHIDKAARLDYLAYYDVLTGLANRALFLDRTAQHLRNAASGGYGVAMFLLDLERFKTINDTLGPPCGDALLKQVAEWLTGRGQDASLLARLEADHFAVILPEVRQQGSVAHLLEKTMDAFQAHPFRLNEAVIQIAAKVGVAQFPADGATAEALFLAAEAALKKAKSSGERSLFFTPQMADVSAGKLNIESQLRRALQNHEFVLHYQPRMNVASGKFTAAEALIRWNDPAAGLVPPLSFMPVLEETGLIHEVGRWVMHQAIEEHLRWGAAGLPGLRIAVNILPRQFRHRDFIDEVRLAISVDPRAAAGLELEITESLIMRDVQYSIDVLTAIRALGVTIAIDNFGTGFSSLNYLSKLPVDRLKIDRSFIMAMTAAPEGLALVSLFIKLARSLKLKVVAEGVETEEQARLLRLLDCDEMQGYLFSKPVPMAAFEEKFLAANCAIPASEDTKGDAPCAT